ncbi:MAG: hypothetical protein F4Y75_00390 [Acidimicrobiia bacterium]|nr:hypothetical protein [bacterium]MDE0644221.1 hypothetical protein [bacterium]MXZ05970.1 hypothetical protein [Acidimicrobiia bacterium]MYD03382.1 hypothetical protein [Acidimicrobiia bacterium]MYF27085.1 hypothetical protein [Acidimicrobiia bacterium]
MNNTTISKPQLKANPPARAREAILIAEQSMVEAGFRFRVIPGRPTGAVTATTLGNRTHRAA